MQLHAVRGINSLGVEEAAAPRIDRLAAVIHDDIYH